MSPIGWRIISGSGRKALTVWMTICGTCRKRRKAMVTRGIMANEEQELVLTRVFDAPRELVFKVWTDPEHVALWWGPHRFTNPVCELDLRPGGAILIHMRGPDGVVYRMTGVYREVVEPERLVFTSAALGGAGNPLFELLTTATFAEEGAKKKQILLARVIKTTAQTAPYLPGMEARWTHTLE